MERLDADYVRRMREALTSYCDELAAFNKSQGGSPKPGSQAATEQAAFERPESLVTVQAIANFLIESGYEHVSLYVKTITAPIEPIACWTCVRSMLESCALAAWLLDPGTDARTRVGRSFALRYEGLVQEIKFGRAVGRAEEELGELEKHIDEVEKTALALGYPRQVNKKQERTSIGDRKLSATDVIALMLGEEVSYRLLSAVAHGHFWALISLGYKPAPDDQTGQSLGGVKVGLFDKTVDPLKLAYLGMRAATALAKPVWYQCRYFGWDVARLVEVLEWTFDKLQATPAVRFWRQQPQ